MSLHDSLHSPHNQCAVHDAGSDGTRAKRKQFGVFFVPADGSGAAAYMERRLRHVPDLWATSGKILLTH